MTLHLNSIPGFNDVPDGVLEAEDSASAVALARISQNAAFGMVRCEFFSGIYADGDTVALPVSTVDGYAYSRDELVYQWGLYSTFNKDSHWITGPDSLWYAAWLVDQDTGLVSTSEYYRRSSNTHPNGQKSNDGQLLVFTIAQRLKTFGLPAPTLGDVPSVLESSNAFAANGSSILLMKGSGIGAQPFRKLRFRLQSSSTVIAYTIHAAKMLVTPAGNPNSVVDEVILTFKEGAVLPLALGFGEKVYCDDVNYTFDQDHDYYFITYCTNAENGRVNHTTGSTGTRGSLRCGYLADDITNPVNYAALALFVPFPSEWQAFDRLELTRGSAFALPDQFKIIPDAEFYQDRPLNTGLITAISRNAKAAIFNLEVLYMGEFVDGDVVPNPVSPYDGFVYDYANVIFQHSWRWTCNGTTFSQPDMDLGQLDRLNAVVDSDGTVEIDVQYYPAHGSLPSHKAGHGRLVVIAYCQRQNVVNGDGS